MNRCHNNNNNSSQCITLTQQQRTHHSSSSNYRQQLYRDNNNNSSSRILSLCQAACCASALHPRCHCLQRAPHQIATLQQRLRYTFHSRPPLPTRLDIIISRWLSTTRYTCNQLPSISIVCWPHSMQQRRQLQRQPVTWQRQQQQQQQVMLHWTASHCHRRRLIKRPICMVSASKEISVITVKISENIINLY